MTDSTFAPQRAFLSLAGRNIEVQRTRGLVASARSIVLLHEGMGSISAWRDFPQALAAATGCEVLAYSRYGYGQSEVLAGPRAPDYMHREALEALPQFIRAAGLAAPILFGHSDGASIALIYAGAAADGAHQLPAIAGVIVEAPHVFVEREASDGARRARAAFDTRGADAERSSTNGSSLAAAVARHHRDPVKTFFGWHDIWTALEFRDWNIEASLPSIAVPVLAIQGRDDEYGTMAHLQSIARHMGDRCELLELAQCGHAPHRDQTAAVLAAASRFCAMLAPASPHTSRDRST